MTRTTHGETLGGRKTKEYQAWGNMNARCYKRSTRNFHLWGGRGITVCERWRHSFPNFLADVGRCPTPGFQIDRIDNGGNYEPGNVCWVSRATQNRNKRTNRIVTYLGRSMPLQDWASETGVPQNTLHYRLAHWTIERALTTPARGKMHKAANR